MRDACKTLPLVRSK